MTGARVYKRVAVMHATSVSGNTKMYTKHLVKFLEGALNAYVIDSRLSAERLVGCELLIIVNSLYTNYCDFLDHAKRLCFAAGRVVYIHADTAIQPPEFLQCYVKDNPVDVWATQRTPVLGMSEDRYTRINLHFMSCAEAVPSSVPCKRIGGLMYYGSFRRLRTAQFDKYLSGEDGYAVHIIPTSLKVGRLFQERFPAAVVYGLFDSLHQLNFFSATVYVEDPIHTKMHPIFPAGRLYDCIHCGVAVAVDVDAVETLCRAGKNFGAYSVSSPSDVLEFLTRTDEVAIEQRRLIDFQVEYAETTRLVHEAAGF